MHLDKKLEKYLVGDIDFSEFYLVSVEPVTDTYAAIFLAPKSLGQYKYFNVRYGHLSSNFFCSMEAATKFAVESGYISKLKAAAINARYYSAYRGEHK